MRFLGGEMWMGGWRANWVKTLHLSLPWLVIRLKNKLCVATKKNCNVSVNNYSKLFVCFQEIGARRNLCVRNYWNASCMANEKKERLLFFVVDFGFRSEKKPSG